MIAERTFVINQNAVLISMSICPPLYYLSCFKDRIRSFVTGQSLVYQSSDIIILADVEFFGYLNSSVCCDFLKGVN